MMNCKDFKELLSAYADGELSLTQTDFIEEHLSACPDCVAALNSYKETNMMITSLRKIQAMPDIKDATMSKIKGKQLAKPSRKWLHPALIAIAVTGLIAALFMIDGNGTGMDGGVMAPPPLSYIILNYIAGAALIFSGIVTLGLILKNRLAFAVSDIGSALLGIVSWYIAIYAFIHLKSDGSFMIGIFPVLGLIMGLAYIQRKADNRWTAITGIVLCISVLIFDVIYLIKYPAPAWIILLTIMVPFIIMLFAYRESIYAGIKSLVFHRGITGSPRKWLRPVAFSLSVVAIVTMLFALQPWADNNGYTTLFDKVAAAAENVDSYRMEIVWTADEIVDGETYESYINFTYEFVSDEITHVIIDYGTVSNYNGVGTYSEGSFENYYIGEDMYSLADRDKAHSFLFQQVGFYYIYMQSGQRHAMAVLDFMNDLVQLEDEVIDGVNCLHYIGTPKLYEDIIDMQWEIWLGEDDYLTRQIKVDYGTHIITTRYYDYNVEINVDMPVDADGNLKEGWEVEPIQSSEEGHLQTSIVFVPVDEAIAALTGDEDWDDVSVVEEILMAMLTSTDWIVYFNALPEEGQQAVHDYVKDSYEKSIATTTKELDNNISFDRTHNIIHYSNSATGQDVHIDAGEITGENSAGLMSNDALVAYWVSTFTANDPQYLFDAFPVETREEMISMFYNNNTEAFILLTDELYGGWDNYGKHVD